MLVYINDQARADDVLRSVAEEANDNGDLIEQVLNIPNRSEMTLEEIIAEGCGRDVWEQWLEATGGVA